MLQKLIYLVALGGLVAATTLLPAEALAGGNGYYRQTYGHQDWRDARDYRIITEPKVRLQIQHRHYHPGYGYYAPYGYVAPSQPVWVPAAWQWNGYQWVWIPGYWSW